LQKPENAIFNTPYYGPTFGSGYDLCVGDYADSTSGSSANIGKCYHNDKYKYQDKAAWERFCGNSTCNWTFKIKEWEVWAVEWA
jgi:hypothetical protein